MRNTGWIGSEIHVDWSDDKLPSTPDSAATGNAAAGKDYTGADSSNDPARVGSKRPSLPSVYTPCPERPEASAAPGAKRSHGYATPEGWKRYREKIVELYKGKTLREVLETMERDHNFVATERMYKARFKEWGINKNVTADYIASLPSGEQRKSPRQGQDPPCVEPPRDIVTTLAHPDVDRIRKYISRGSSGLRKLEAKERSRVIAVFGSPEDNRIRKNTRRSGSRLESRAYEEATKARCLPQVAVPNPQHVLNSLECLFTAQKPVSSLHTSTTTTPFDNALLPLYPDPDYFSSTNPWPQQVPPLPIHEWHMLDFEIKFRLAHILFEGLNQEGCSRLLQACVHGLSHALQATGPDNSGAITSLIYVILTALETATSFDSSSILLWLFDQLAVIWAQHHPLTANVAIQISHYDSHDSLLDLLKKARQSIPTDLGSSVAGSISLQVYLEIVDTAVNTGLPTEVYSALQATANRVLAGTLPLASEALIVWVELRSAIALYEANAFSGLPISSPPSEPNETHANAIRCILDHLKVQRDFYEAGDGWAIAGRLDREMREISRLVEGGDAEAPAIVPDTEGPRLGLGRTGSAPRRSCGRCGKSGHYVQTCKKVANSSKSSSA